MHKTRTWLRVCGVLAMVVAMSATFAGPAGARITKAKKQAIQRKLIRELKHNPKLIRNHRWLRAAGHVDAFLPLTIRLNPIVATDGTPADGPFREEASDDTASLDLTDTFGPSVGSKTTTLTGKVEATAHFGNPAEGDSIGDLRLTVDSANLYAASVGVLDNPTAGATCATFAPNDNQPDISFQANSQIPAVVVNGAPGYAGTATGSTVAASTLAPSVVPNTVVRTAPIHLQAISIPGSPNIGKANLFATTNNVRLSLHTSAQVNTIFRSLGTTEGLGAGSLPTAQFICDEIYAGATNSSGLTSSDIGTPGHANVIPVNVTGNLTISPAVTTDGKLRLAKVSVSSPTADHATVDACLQPHALVDNLKARNDSNVFTGSPTALVDTGGTPSTANCDATYIPANFPLESSGVQEITGVGPTGVSAKFLQLEPDVQVTNLTADALVGQGASY